ncbi:MAG: molybdenum cofactor guanylyltransferase MobA, partial [Alphaproteobacteria bacterium]
IACRDDLRQMLSVENERRVEAWTARLGLAVVDFSARPLDPFLNVNRPEDLAAAERIIAGS